MFVIVFLSKKKVSQAHSNLREFPKIFNTSFFSWYAKYLFNFIQSFHNFYPNIMFRSLAAAALIVASFSMRADTQVSHA